MQDSLQHYSSYVRSILDFWSTSNYCTEVPRSPPASRVRSVRVSMPVIQAELKLNKNISFRMYNGVYLIFRSSECDVVRGQCTQTYVPYLFLVIPLGPVTLTGQDYVLVESGCVCKPRYSSKYSSEANSLSAIP